MIPRLRPPISLGDLGRSCWSFNNPREDFERRFAEKFGFPYGLYFPYGRSALHTLLSALQWRDQEVVLPAYTCVVMAHAVTLSGNRARFVDSDADHFLVSADSLAATLSPSTRMVLPTPLFGYPVDRAGYARAIRSRAPRALVVYDLAHGFGVEDEEGPQADGADAAIFGLGIGKLLSTLYGGMLLLRDRELFHEVKQFRDRTFRAPARTRTCGLLAYGLASWLAFREPFLTPIDLLERRTRLLHGVTEYYYGKSGPTLPADWDVHPTAYQARLGLKQLPAYDDLVARRREHSAAYQRELRAVGFDIFSSHGWPTFSHLPLAVADRGLVLAGLHRQGVQAGKLVDYSCADLPGYLEQSTASPHASWFGGHMINLPNWPHLRTSDVQRVVGTLCRLRDTRPGLFDLPPNRIAPARTA